MSIHATLSVWLSLSRHWVEEVSICYFSNLKRQMAMLKALIGRYEACYTIIAFCEAFHETEVSDVK